MDLRAQQVRDMFSAIASRYDLLNRLLSLGLDTGWRSRAAQSCSPGEDSLFLDACGGTGDLAVAFLKRHCLAEALVLDFSHPMLRIALEKGKKWPGRIQPVAGDVLRLPFRDGQFDALGCAFGIRNLTDLGQGFGEFYRVLRPGGTLCILEFTPGKSGIVGCCVRWYVARVVPFVGRLLSPHRGAYDYLSTSVAGFLSGGELLARLQRAGFEHLRLRSLSFGACSLITGVRSPSRG